MKSRTTAIALVTAAVIVPLGIFGAPALARTASASGSSQYQYKVAICHHTHSKKHPFHVIVVSSKAVAKHMLRHGDTLAPCPTVPAPAPKQHGHGNGQGNDDQGTAQTGSTTHGNSGNHGQSGQHGNNGNGNGKGHDK